MAKINESEIDLSILKKKCDKKSYEALAAINNKALHRFLISYIDLCNPASVFVRTDSAEDAEYIRKKAVEKGEERNLAIASHTAHFDGYNDQARDKENTKYLLPSPR